MFFVSKLDVGVGVFADTIAVAYPCDICFISFHSHSAPPPLSDVLRMNSYPT